jgi:antibiotic biosynthesis monooxygenase (ABM) superfamily enzyme
LEEAKMTAMNVVHVRVKPGREADFVKLNQEFERQDMPGMRHIWVVKAGERSYIVVGEWDSFDAIVNSRSMMIANLDKMRDMLEDLGGGRGVTEPYSGEAVVEISAP